MKLRYQFEIVDMGDEIVAVPVGDEKDQLHGVIRLNDIGVEIFSLLEEDTTPEKVHAAMMEKYPGSSKDEIGKMLESFFNTLLHEGVLIP